MLVIEALGEQIPEAEFVVPDGGYFLWLDLAEGTDSVALLAEAKGGGVSFVAGPDFMIEGGANGFRLSFAPVPAGPAPARACGGSPRRLSSSAPALRLSPSSPDSGQPLDQLDVEGGDDRVGQLFEGRLRASASDSVPSTAARTSGCSKMPWGAMPSTGPSAQPSPGSSASASPSATVRPAWIW